MNKKILFKYANRKYDTIYGFEMPFINIFLLKHITRLISSLYLFARLNFRNKIDTVLIHGLHSPFLIVALIAKVFSFKTIVVVTDPPGVILSNDSIVTKIFKYIDTKFIKYIFKFAIDGVLTLSDNLPTHLGFAKPYLFLPGFVDSELLNLKNSIHNSELYENEFNITYAGSLNIEYGVKELLDAFLLIESSNLKLNIFGKGNLEEYIVAASKIDSRVVFHGYQNNKEVFLKLSNSNLLVNPRPIDNFISINSFPSKILEYMITGVPFITTKIPTIPNFFDNYLNYFDVFGVESIHIGLLKMINSNQKELKLKANSAKQFIEENYNEKLIGSEIVKYIDKI
jgi:glycosyltransferase involved in cell wall biosynthesis